MNESGKIKLHSLLFSGDTSLVNIKLFPGTGRGLSADALGGAAADAIAAAADAWRNGVPSRSPVSGMQRRPLKA